jgi:hypothetical protein
MFVFLRRDFSIETASGTATDGVIPLKEINFKFFITNWAENIHSGFN